MAGVTDSMKNVKDGVTDCRDGIELNIGLRWSVGIIDWTHTDKCVHVPGEGGGPDPDLCYFGYSLSTFIKKKLEKT